MADRLLDSVPVVFSHLLYQARIPYLAIRASSLSAGEVILARLWVLRDLRVSRLSRWSVASFSWTSWALVIATAAAISRSITSLYYGLPALRMRV